MCVVTRPRAHLGTPRQYSALSARCGHQVESDPAENPAKCKALSPFRPIDTSTVNVGGMRLGYFVTWI